MVRYNIAAAVLLSVLLNAVDGFQPSPLGSYHASMRLSGTKSGGRGAVAASTPYFDDESRGGKGTLGDISGRFNATTAYRGISEAMLMDDEEDEEFRSPAERRRKVIMAKDMVGRERFAYDVTLPLQTDMTKAQTSMGISVRQVFPGGKISERALDLETLQFQSSVEELRGGTKDRTGTGSVETLESLKQEVIDDNFKGIIVSSVVRGGLAWEAGVRAGDELVATSATMGNKLWPKSTLDGVRSAILSRKIMCPSVSFKLTRSGAYMTTSEVVEEFEMSLTRPLGIQVEDSEDGYVKITGFVDEPQELVAKNLRIGDRVVAVDSSLGSQMWPVSNVEGLASACTSRLPGQPVKLRFERIVEVGGWDSGGNGNVKGAEDPVTAMESVSPALTATADGFRKLKVETSNSEGTPNQAIQSTGSNTHKMLLSRCRDIMRRYMDKDTIQSNADTPGIVADRVLETLADASAPLDSRTLSLIMDGYLASRRPADAIRAFEACVGLPGDGSLKDVAEVVIAGKKNPGASIVPDMAALNLFTATALLKAFAMEGDLYSARRALAAMEGKRLEVGGVNAEPWQRSQHENWVTDARCYNVVLSAAAKAGSPQATELAVHLFDSMAEPSPDSLVGKPSKTAVSYNTMIAVFANAGRLQDAYTIFYSMKQAGLKPDKFTYTSLIKAAVESGDAKQGQSLLTEMEGEGVDADVLSYNTVIKGLCDQYRWYDAKELVTEMEWNGVSPDSVTYGLLMNGLLKAGKPGPCLTLFESACADPRTTLRAQNVQIYTTAVTAASTMGDHARALGLVARMVDAGIKPNIKTFTSLMGGCISSGKAGYAVEVFNKIDEPDGYALTLGIKALCDSGDYAGASRILSEQRDGYKLMSGKQIMSSYNYFIQSALERFRYTDARRAMTELLQSGYIPSKASFDAILDGLGISKQRNDQKRPKVVRTNQVSIEAKTKHDFLLFVLDMMEMRNLLIPSSFYASVLFEGEQIGGLRKKVSSLLAKARAESIKDGEEISSDIVECSAEASCLGWEDIVRNYSEYKDKLGEQIGLPTLHVRVGTKDYKQVIAAERAVTYGISRPRAIRRRGKNRQRQV